jgi:hypothetical protein
MSRYTSYAPLRTNVVRSTITDLINHAIIVIDGSGSMGHLQDKVVKVADELVATLAKKSKETDQETRVSLYVFEQQGDIKCWAYDKDVLRMPSLKGKYRTVGGTPLIDATILAIEDLQKTATLYGDHAFLAYVITDGQENASSNKPADLKKLLNSLADNWTVACFVPNASDKRSAEAFGFPPENVQIWETNEKGLQTVQETITRSVNSYYTMRSTGVRGSKNLFSLDLSKVTASKVASKLTPLHFGQYRLYDVTTKQRIDSFVEDKTGRAYRLGEAYYQLMVPVKVQPSKAVCLWDRKTKKLYTGDAARKLLGLPNHEVKLEPAATPDFDIFIQSTSVNRNVLPGQKIVVLS